MTSVGLRETRKIQLTQAVQREALRLFAAQGYERTTVEQIAEAAGVSTTTFYRYFSSKEDIVLFGQRTPVIEDVLDSRPVTEELPDAVRNALIGAVLTVLEPERDDVLARLQLIYLVPALHAAFLQQRQASVERFTRVLARRAGYSGDEFLLRLAATLVIEAVNETIHYWVDNEGHPALAELVGQAVDGIKPILAGLAAHGSKPAPSVIM
jgi:AcrR family transcriptional regulator